MTADRSVSLATAERLIELRRYAEAETRLSSVVTGDNDPAVLCLLAQARLGLDDHRGALEAATAAISTDPDREWPHRLASVAATQLGDRAQAVDFARAAVRCAPHLAETHARLGLALTGGLRHRREASREASEAVRLNPDLVDAHLAFGAVAASQFRIGAARKAYRRALSIDPQSFTAHNNLAQLDTIRRLGTSPRALARAAVGFSGALSIDPREQAAVTNLSRVFRMFLGQAQWWALICAYIGFRLASGTNVPRWAFVLPAVLLILPVSFVAIFVRGITTSLRRHIVYLLAQEYRLPSLILTVLAAPLLVLGACYAPAAKAAFIAAFVLAATGRFVLWLGKRRAA